MVGACLVSGLVWRRAQVCDAEMQGFVRMGRAPRRDPALPMSDSLARHDDGLVCRGLQRGRDGDSILCAAEKCRLYLWFMKVLALPFPFFCRTVLRYFSRKLWLHSLLIHQIHRPCLWHFCCWSSRIIGVHICAIPPRKGRVAVNIFGGQARRFPEQFDDLWTGRDVGMGQRLTPPLGRSMGVRHKILWMVSKSNCRAKRNPSP